MKPSTTGLPRPGWPVGQYTPGSIPGLRACLRTGRPSERVLSHQGRLGEIAPRRYSQYPTAPGDPAPETRRTTLRSHKCDLVCPGGRYPVAALGHGCGAKAGFGSSGSGNVWEENRATARQSGQRKGGPEVTTREKAAYSRRHAWPVHPANIQDRVGAELVLAPLIGQFPGLTALIVGSRIKSPCGILWV